MSINYTIYRANKKNISIIVKSDGTVEVRAPINCSTKIIDEFVQKKEKWINKTIEKQKDNILIGNLSDEDFLKARKLTQKKVDIFLKSYPGKQPVGYKIRKQKTVWGTCNNKGNISINALAGLLPDELFEYIMIHELAHLQVLYHNTYFWNLVSYYIPDWSQRRKKLKKYRIE